MSERKFDHGSPIMETGLQFGSTSFGPRTNASEESSDDSTEAYREKVENLKDLIGNLNRQLNSEKIRAQAIDTVTNLLQEERKLNRKLEDELNRCKDELKALKGRQFRMDPSEMDQQSSELESVKNENISLMNELRYLSIDPAKMDEILKECDLLKMKMSDLSTELTQLKEENLRMKQILAMSSEEKQCEISKLIGQLDETKQKGKLNDVLFKSLSDQIQVLQRRLHQTDATCQQLLFELKQHRTQANQGGGSGTAGMAGTSAPTLPSFVQTEMNIPSLGINHVASEERVKVLEAQLKEVNQKWKEYDSKRNTEFDELKQELQKKNQKLAEASSQLSEKQQEEIDRLLLQYKRQIDGIETDKEKLLDENRKLRVELNTLVKDNEKVENRLKSLLRQKQNKTSEGVSSSSSEEIQLLQWQVRTFGEDFQQEKSDRERAEQHVKDLEKQINAFKIRLSSMERERRNWQRQHHYRSNTGLIQCDDDNDIDIDAVEMPQPSSPPLILTGRGLYQSDCGEGLDEVDQTSDDVIRCPECLTEFPKSCHSDLLRHMNKCLK
ncbi:hypothetical protein LSH36_39g16036 [Paralvinella palmiformis]|uniref:Uncharacterized protein n=1 Tax=Paralvinella palmiformis TaxID=53620 RepID=A0AAD9K7Q0_9ANNE|nr:hypothetical protein LSH36_39g16036 [Paralvinella palmiformis]